MSQYNQYFSCVLCWIAFFSVYYLCVQLEDEEGISVGGGNFSTELFFVLIKVWLLVPYWRWKLLFLNSETDYGQEFLYWFCMFWLRVDSHWSFLFLKLLSLLYFKWFQKGFSNSLKTFFKWFQWEVFQKYIEIFEKWCDVLKYFWRVDAFEFIF